jgi:hypothetical protein
MIIDFIAVRSKMQGLLWNAVEALPLPVFLICLQWQHPVAWQDWRLPYYLSTAVAIITTAIALARQQTLNRIYLSLNLYFLSGSIGVGIGWQWLNNFYGMLEATGMLLWVVAVGFASTLGSRAGFIGVIVRDRQALRRWSWSLLAIAVAATLLSWGFIGNVAMSAYLPFISLFAAHAVLRGQAKSSVVQIQSH